MLRRAEPPVAGALSSFRDLAQVVGKGSQVTSLEELP